MKNSSCLVLRAFYFFTFMSISNSKFFYKKIHFWCEDTYMVQPSFVEKMSHSSLNDLTCMFTSRLSILLHRTMYLFFHQYHTDVKYFRFVPWPKIKYCKSSNFLKSFMAVLFLPSHINFRISLSISTINLAEIRTGIVLNI